jgi:ankyrin repeat protein
MGSIDLARTINQRDSFGNTPLMLAVSFNRLNHAMYALMGSQVCLILVLYRALLSAGADPTIVNRNRQNALHLLCAHRSATIKLVSALLDRGVNISAQGKRFTMVLRLRCNPDHQTSTAPQRCTSPRPQAIRRSCRP